MPDDHRSRMKSTGLTSRNLSAELAELLNRLDLSPSVLLEEGALAIDKNSSYSSESGSLKYADIEKGYPDEFAVENTMDRNALLEELAVVRADGKVNVARNKFFHDQLVEHFRRKQMMRVYGEPNEADPLKYKYEKHLSKYEQLREELQAGEESFKEELNLLKEDLRKKMDEADAAVEDLLSKQRAAGAQAYANGKPLAAKEIQLLIARELGKMKDISKIRIRYARLRDSLVEKEVVFDALNILAPNLDQKDYERLEAEHFYYKHELKMKEKKAEELGRKRDAIIRHLKRIKHKRKNLNRVILRRREICEELNLKIKKISRRGLIRKRKIKQVKKYFEKFESILGLRMYPEVHAKMKNVQARHKEWFEKVANLMKEIKEKDLRLKSLEPYKNFHKSKETEADDEDTDENIPSHQKSRRPPLGGGFLQAL